MEADLGGGRPGRSHKQLSSLMPGGHFPLEVTSLNADNGLSVLSSSLQQSSPARC
jgi:hypothetical protein